MSLSHPWLDEVKHLRRLDLSGPVRSIWHLFHTDILLSAWTQLGGRNVVHGMRRTFCKARGRHVSMFWDYVNSWQLILTSSEDGLGGYGSLLHLLRWHRCIAFSWRRVQTYGTAEYELHLHGNYNKGKLSSAVKRDTNAINAAVQYTVEIVSSGDPSHVSHPKE